MQKRNSSYYKVEHNMKFFIDLIKPAWFTEQNTYVCIPSFKPRISIA